jgi:hypothetical protein
MQMKSAALMYGTFVGIIFRSRSEVNVVFGNPHKVEIHSLDSLVVQYADALRNQQHFGRLDRLLLQTNLL